MRPIDGDKLIETYCEENCGSRRCRDAMDRCVFIDHVRVQPTIDQYGGWIPCKERLPEETDYYYVTLDNGDTDSLLFNSRKDPYTNNSPMLDKFLYCDNRGDWHTHWRKVIAWRPFPDPYVEEK